MVKKRSVDLHHPEEDCNNSSLDIERVFEQQNPNSPVDAKKHSQLQACICVRS